MSHKDKLRWDKIEEDAFDKGKRIVARDNLSTYPELMKNLKFTLMLAISN